MMKEAGRDLRILFNIGAIGGLSDGQLLERFASQREEAAFEALVHRHGPMVWGVCRRIVRNPHDAEDAFQATFLVLARKAHSLADRELVANWLYAVAYKTAVRAEALACRRRAREHQVMEMPEPEPGKDHGTDDLLPLLDRELRGLPEKYRTPILLCDLEGKTHKEAALQLGCPVGTVSGRLSRARAMLAKRLARRGVTLSVGALAAALSRDARAAGAPPRLLEATVQIGMLSHTGTMAVTASLRGIVKGGVKQMLTTKLGLATLAILVAGAVAVPLASPVPRPDADGGPSAARAPSAEEVPKDDRPKASAAARRERARRQWDSEREAIRQLRGTWEIVKTYKNEVEEPFHYDYYRWQFEDETVRITWKRPGEQAGAANHGKPLQFSISPTKEPKELTVHGAHMLLQMLYQLDNNQLKLYFYGRAEVERPQGFTTETTRDIGSGLIVYVLERRDVQP
jgi:RNA polymerase sigma-70 factor (ECF subfamily)